MWILARILQFTVAAIVIIGLWASFDYSSKNWGPVKQISQVFIDLFYADEFNLSDFVAAVRPKGWTITNPSSEQANLYPSLIQTDIKKVKIKAVPLVQMKISGELSPSSIVDALYQEKISEYENSYNPLITDSTVEYYKNFEILSSSTLEAVNGTWVDVTRKNQESNDNWRLMFQVYEDSLIYLEFFYNNPNPNSISYEILDAIAESVRFLEKSEETDATLPIE